jgi:uncharacterized membrane protein YciS (DUF1049 family)
VRNALILLVVVALIILLAGAMNSEVTFDIDYVVGTVEAVSLFWVAAVVAAVVFVVGVVAAWLARMAVGGSRRKLEAELQATYERLREAESLVSRAAPVATAAAPDETPAATVVAQEAATVVEAGETETAVEVSEAATVVHAGEAVTVVTGAGSLEDDASAAAEAEAAVADEATAITVVGEGEGDAAEGSPAEPREEEPATGEVDRGEDPPRGPA